jgi:hypothetical protein
MMSGLTLVLKAEPKTSAPPPKATTTPKLSAPIPPKVALEPVCVAIEPKALRTSASQNLAGARQTVLTPAIEREDGFKMLDRESLTHLGMNWETFLAKAKQAASRHLAALKPEIHKDPRGTIEYIKFHNDRHLTSSILLCPELWKQFSPMLGPTIVALVPDRFTVYLFPRQSGAFVKQGQEVAALFTDAMYPASDEAFEISETTFKSIGNFTTSEPE